MGGRLRGLAYDAWFRVVHRSRLVYNACWEDPRIDRALLGLGRSSRVVMITSAGCNALDYLLDDPAEIHAVDVNPRQNALLELKLAIIRIGRFEDLFRAFGHGGHAGFDQLLEDCRPLLSPSAQEFWNSKRHYLNGRHARRSFYYQGSSGDVAWAMRTLVLRRRERLWKHVHDLLEAGSLREQREVFYRLEPLLWGRFSQWLVRQPMTLSLLGVPRSQTRMIQLHHPRGVLGYVQDKVRHVATQVPMWDNYFWRVYITGEYSDSCCPEYLRRGNFGVLQARSARVRTHTQLLTDFLECNPGAYTHYVLLDHQDWLASADPGALASEWKQILKNSQPGTKILFRSAAPRLDFLPGFVSDRVRFATERTMELHERDRVGTYGSLHLAEVR